MVHTSFSCFPAQCAVWNQTGVPHFTMNQKSLSQLEVNGWAGTWIFWIEQQVPWKHLYMFAGCMKLLVDNVHINCSRIVVVVEQALCVTKSFDMKTRLLNCNYVIMYIMPNGFNCLSV